MGPEGSYYRVHNSPPPVPILSQIKPVHTLTPYFSIVSSYLVPRTVSSIEVLQLKFYVHFAHTLGGTVYINLIIWTF
jgi:hypothetical protein